MSGYWRRRIDPEASRREISWALGFLLQSNGGGDWEVLPDPPGLMFKRPPLTPMQALMEAEPHQEPLASAIDHLDLRDVIADALEDMDPRERWIFEATVNRGLSVREIAAELHLAKSYVHRLYHRSRRNLQTLEDHPAARPRLRSI